MARSKPQYWQSPGVRATSGVAACEFCHRRPRTTGHVSLGQALTRIAIMDLPAEPNPSTPLLVVRHAARVLRAGEVVRLTADGVATDTRAAEAVADEDPAAQAA